MSNISHGYPAAYPNSSMNYDASAQIHNVQPKTVSTVEYNPMKVDQLSNVYTGNYQDSSDLDSGNIEAGGTYENLFSLLNNINMPSNRMGGGYQAAPTSGGMMDGMMAVANMASMFG